MESRDPASGRVAYFLRGALEATSSRARHFHNSKIGRTWQQKSPSGTDGEKSGRWDSNPRRQPWEGCILPLNYARNISSLNKRTYEFSIPGFGQSPGQFLPAAIRCTFVPSCPWPDFMCGHSIGGCSSMARPQQPHRPTWGGDPIVGLYRPQVEVVQAVVREVVKT